jgi:anti-sigma regulatory factor (Ser/Thr protein kinase)
MPVVELSFPPSAEHVRTARLVAVAVARRAGLDEQRLDEVRLAVGETCARAVRRCRSAALEAGIELWMEDSGSMLRAVVTDRAGLAPGEDEVVALALVRGLADTVAVEAGPGGPGGVVRLAWAMTA